jgi:hypothetical protein
LALIAREGPLRVFPDRFGVITDVLRRRGLDDEGDPAKGALMVTIETYKRAERDLMYSEARRGFKVHAAVYALVMSALTVLNVLLVLYTDAGFFWFPFPLVGWGIGLTMHYAFGVRGAERAIGARQAEIERRAENLKVAA